MSTLASVAHESSGWKILSHNLPPKTIPISAVMFTEASLQCRRRFYEEESDQDFKQAASVTSLPGEAGVLPISPSCKTDIPISSANCQVYEPPDINTATKVNIVVEILIIQICCMFLRFQFRL